MIIDTPLEWLVIASGILLAFFVLAPSVPQKIGVFISSLIPHPSKVNEWLVKDKPLISDLEAEIEKLEAKIEKLENQRDNEIDNKYLGL